MDKARILVVDDEESIRFTFDTFLGEAGYAVATAADHDAAVRRLEGARFDLVFADILLGEKTGLDLLRRIRSADPVCPVILITGAPNVDTASQAVRLGAYDYIPKPINRDTLLRVCRMALSVRRLREERDKDRRNLEAIFDSVRDGIVTVDDELNVLAVNRLAGRLCCQPGLAAGSNGGCFAEAHCGTCRSVLVQCLEKRRMVRAERVRCRRSDREQVLSLTATPLVDGRGGYRGAVMMIHDETRLDSLERDLGERTRLQRLCGKSEAMQRVFHLIEALGDVDTTVLVTGESGTGKELVAEALHYTGDRRNGPLVKVNCAALTESLLETELFGHVKGAFTGAVRDKVGRFQAADGGTIFLDEIGDISPGLQVRLLRVLQEKEFERVGDSRPVRVDVRVVAATNQDLAARVRRGEFREDLYYRLKVVGIHLPPLRERREDLPLLVEQFVERFNQKLECAVEGVDEEVMRAFLAYPWPGNVRELEHALEHAFVLCRQGRLEPAHLPAELQAAAQPQPVPAVVRETALSLEKALERAGGNKAKAARLLGISRRTLYRRLDALDEPGA